MGSYTNNLYRAQRARRLATQLESQAERLTGAAIVRNGSVHSVVKGSHAEVRGIMGDDDPYVSNLNDTEGFVTSTRRFVTRDEAMIIGERAGQCRPSIRKLLSSDIDW